jgi:hypothetical protein
MTQLTEIKLVLTSELREHEHAGIIPEMTAEEWKEFLENVRIRGEIIKPLEILPDGRIIDGRHRYRAAKECGIEYVTTIEKCLDDVGVLDYMLDSGLRRNLTQGQRAAAVLKRDGLVSGLREKAKANQGKRNDIVPDSERSSQRQVITLAEKAGIGKSSMATLQAVQKKDAELFDRVASGEITINKAHTEMKKREQPIEATTPKKPIDDIITQYPVNEEFKYTSPNNSVGYAKKAVYDATTSVLTVFKKVEQADADVKELYFKELINSIESSLITLDMYEEKESISDIVTLCLEVFRKYKIERGN